MSPCWQGWLDRAKRQLESGSNDWTSNGFAELVLAVDGELQYRDETIARLQEEVDWLREDCENLRHDHEGLRNELNA